MKRMTFGDKLDILYQFNRIITPSRVVDLAVDRRRMVVYAAVEYHHYTGEGCSVKGYLPEGHVYAVIATLWENDGGAGFNFNDEFEVSSDDMWAEEYISLSQYCHCPISLLDKLSPPRNERAQEWRDKCRRNANRKRAK